MGTFWFREITAGESDDYPSFTDGHPDADRDVSDADAEADPAVFGRQVELARAAAAGRPLDQVCTDRGRERNLRWVYVHSIEEYARHNGHADLIRERPGGVTGDRQP